RDEGFAGTTRRAHRLPVADRRTPATYVTQRDRDGAPPEARTPHLPGIGASTVRSERSLSKIHRPRSPGTRVSIPTQTCGYQPVHRGSARSRWRGDGGCFRSVAVCPSRHALSVRNQTSRSVFPVL